MPLPSMDSPFLLLHGILGDERTFEPIQNAYPDGSVFTHTLSGAGIDGANIDAVHFNTRIHSDQLIEHCAQNFTQPVTLVAWSYSCHVALLAALKAPHLFKALYLYDCIVPSYGLEEDDTALKAFSRDLHKMMSPVIKALRSQNPTDAVDAFVQSCSTHHLRLQDQSPRIQAIKLDNTHTVSRLLTQAEPEPIHKITLSTFPVPVRICWGEDSRVIFRLASKALMDHLPKACLLTGSGSLPECDHLMPEEQPERFIQYILQGA
ncbi:alpha/beta hydrolase [Wohlfahrtiimonas chitiniclastica]|uniref:alpha/beta fold hydrolase n=1 Tax=Wohlfahrtiimonas chitiniclastica TaxID=400946 RepID=UPI0021581872|nr:alpha/beta hydrolase [Wohlfahrtiimonas chitiniclastica]MDC7251342.1 hypothetical protein [Wohlfahrtiimonas chitiniclastica]WHR55032.1 alpha/beta hydrolase [Wohlfahrtiimonas chitiniclastica]